MKYEEVPDEWSRVIHAEVRAGHALEDLVFIKQADGSLRSFGANPPDLGRRDEHCIIVNSVGRRPSGETYADITYVASFDDILQATSDPCGS